MKRDDLERIIGWFEGHVDSYLDMDEEGLKNIILKKEHTLRVLDATRDVAEGEGLSEEETLIASAVAILHDAGRFPQYRRWRTFRDKDSENHANLSANLIRDEGVLDHIGEEDRLLIEEAVRFHNMLDLPQNFRSKTDLFIRLIRDADKLDIWRVFLEYFRQPEDERASAVGLGFPDRPEVTPECVEALENGRIVRLDQCKVLNDFRLLQISWVYDLNFRSTCRLLYQRGYISELSERFSNHPGLSNVLAQTMAYLRLISEEGKSMNPSA